MSRRTLSISLVLIILASAVTVAEPPKNPLLKRTTPSNSAVTEPSVGDGPVKSETTHLDPIAQLQIAVERLDKENKALKAKIDAMSLEAAAFRKDFEEVKVSVLNMNQGPGGRQFVFASRKMIIDGEVPDDAMFRVWYRKGTGNEAPNVKIIP